MEPSTRIAALAGMTASAIDRADRLDHPKDFRRLTGKLEGLEFAAGVILDGNDTQDVFAELVLVRKREAQATRNEHPNTALKQHGKAEGLFIGLGVMGAHS